MAETTRRRQGLSDVLVAGLVLLVLVIMLLPVPPWLLDGLLVMDLGLALPILLVTPACCCWPPSTGSR